MTQNQPYIPQFSGGKEDLEKFEDMILHDLTLKQLATYAQGILPVESITTNSGFILPAVTVGKDGIAGVDTDFPMPIHISQSWNTQLAKNVGCVIGEEWRGKFAVEDPNTIVFAAIADVRCNALNGRFYEGYGEDPVLCDMMVDATAAGVIGEDKLYVKSAVNTKHFSTYNSEWDRLYGSNFVLARGLYEYQFKPFIEAYKKGNLCGCMSSFGMTNGVPNPFFPDLLFLDSMNPFHSYTISDLNGAYRALAGMSNGYDKTYLKTKEELAAFMIKAHSFPNPMDDSAKADNFVNAVEQKLFHVTRKDLEELVRPQIELWIRQGYFSQESYPYRSISLNGTPVTSALAGHQKVALEAAEEGIVLLKNNEVLPISSNAHIMVTGIMANSRVQTFYATETPAGIPETNITPVEALQIDNNYVVSAEDIQADTVWLKSGYNNKYWVIHEDFSVHAAADRKEDASEFQIWDWGQDAYSIYCEKTKMFLSVNEETLEISMKTVAPNDIPTVWTYETLKDGTKVMRYNAILVSLAQTFGGIPFYSGLIQYYEIYNHYGRYLSVEDGTDRLILGNDYEQGYNINAVHIPELISEAGKNAIKYKESCDYAIVFAGAISRINASEGIDRCELVLGEDQIKLIQNVADVFPGKTIVYIQNDFPLGILPLKENEKVAGILYGAYGGEFFAKAIANTIYGKNNPSARLTASWLTDKSSLPPLQDRKGIDPRYTIDMKQADPMEGKMTYLYTNSENVAYEFGYGLSYTDFSYSDFSTSVDCEQNVILISVRVCNIGSLHAGKEIVQIYARSIDSAYGKFVPQKQLIGFGKTNELAPGASEVLSISCSLNNLKKWNVTNNEYFLEEGNYQIMIGKSSENIAFSQDIFLQGNEIGILNMDTSVNVWEKSYAAKDVIAWETSKANTAKFAGEYFSVVSAMKDAYVILPKVSLANKTRLEIKAAAEENGSELIVCQGTVENTIASFVINDTGTTEYLLDPNNTDSKVTEKAYVTLTEKIQNVSDEPQDILLLFKNPDIRIAAITALNE